MGTYQYTDSQTGKLYSFNYGGDAPSDQDFAEMAQYIEQDRARLNELAMRYTGDLIAPEDERMALRRGLDIGATSAYEALGTAARSAGEGFDLEFLRELGAGMETSADYEQLREATQMPAPLRRQDIQGLGTALTFAGEQLGQTLPEMGATIAGGAGGAALGTALGGPKGGLVGFVAGSTAVATPLFFGRNIQRQEQAVEAGTLAEVDRSRALLAAVPQALLNSVADKLLVTGRALGIRIPRSQNLFVRTGQFGAAGAIAEAPTEVGQQIIERAQAGLPIDSDEAISEYLDALVAAGIVGGSVGAATGPFRGAGERRAPDEEAAPETPETPAAPAPAPAPAITQQDLEDIGEGAIDPTAPISLDVLDVLGVPSTSGVYNTLAKGGASDEQVAIALEDYAAGISTDPAQRPAANRIYNYLSARTRAQTAQPELPTGPAAESGRAQPTAAGAGPAGGVPTNIPQPVLGGAQPAAGTQPTAPLGMGMPDRGVGTAAQPTAAQPAALEPLSEADAFELAAQLTEQERAAQQGSRLQPEPAPEPAPQGELELEPAPEQQQLTDDEFFDQLQAQARPAAVEPEPAAEPDPQQEFIDLGINDGKKTKGLFTHTLESKAEAIRKNVSPEAADAYEAAVKTQYLPPEARPAAEPTPAPTAEFQRDAAPGRTTGAAGQVIPPAMQVEGARPRRLTTPQERIEASQRAATLGQQTTASFIEAARQVEAERNAEATQRLGAWFEANLSAPLKEFHSKFPDLGFSADVTTSNDKGKILNLLDKKFTQRAKDPTLRPNMTNPTYAAHEYFRKHPNPSAAIEVIAYDSVLAKTKQYKKPPAKIRDDLGPDADVEFETEYLTHTGTGWANRAAQWVRDNLDAEAVALLDARLREYKRDTVKVASKRTTTRKKYENELDKQFGKHRAGDVASAVEAVDSDVAAEFGLPTDNLDDLYDDLMSFSAAMPLFTNLHPAVVSALRNNNIDFALDFLALTSADPTIQSLSVALKNYTAGVKTSVIATPDMDLLSRTFSDGKPMAGAYLKPRTPEFLARYAPAVQAFMREFENTLVFDENVGLNPITLLHEMIHAATETILANPSSPLTRQLQTLLSEARAALPNRRTELANVGELVAYGMTDPDFIQDLSRVATRVGEQRVSLYERFKHWVSNAIRRIMGKPTKKLLSAKNSIDLMFEDLLAPPPLYPNVSDVSVAAFRTAGAKNVMNRMAESVVKATPQKAKNAGELLYNSTVKNPQVKGFLVDLTLPLQYLTDYAKKYFPSAGRIYELVSEHAGYERRLLDWTNDTIDPISTYFKKHGQEVVDKINKIRYEATENEYQVDPRKPESEYNMFEFTQVDYNPDGTEKRRVRRQFVTRQQRNDEFARLNKTADAKRPRATKRVDPDPDRIAKHKELVALYNSLPEGGQAVVNRLFELPEVYRKELQAAFKARLDAMLPGQKATQERIYREFFDKLFADALIDPYQALSRRGEYKLSYEGTDPDTGQPKLFKHAFTSAAKRREAILALQAMAEAEQNLPLDQRTNNIRNITPYESVDDMSRMGGQVPTNVLVSILNKVAEQNQLGDPQTEQRILELIFETAPETSFLQAFKKRQGTPGYLGDITPLDERLSAGDTLEIIKANGYRLATKAADIRYQTIFNQARDQLLTEYNALMERTLQSGAPPAEIARIQEDAALYFNKLSEATRAPFIPAARWSRTLTSLGYTMALGGNVSTALLTFFQLPLMIFPMLLGKYGGRTAMQAIGRASRVLTGSGKGPEGGRFRTVEQVAESGGIEQVRRRIGMYDFSLANLDYEADPRSAYLKPLHDAAQAAGALTRSMTQELVDASTAIGLTQKIAAWSGLMQHHAERYMRETTMIADYLANAYEKMPGVKNQMSFKQFVRAAEEGRVVIPADLAADVAADAVKTGDYANGSIYAAAAPKLSQTDLGRVLFLFKRFPISMMNLLVHTARRSVGTDPIDRRVARMQLATMSGSMALFAGASGLPLYHTVSMAYDILWPRDEDDEDFETMLRTGFLGELGTKGLANYLFGVNLSDRIGLSGVFYRPPLNSADLPWYGALIEGYGGPVVGLGNRWFNRAPYFFSEGEYYRGLEAALPTAMANTLKSIRFGLEGARTMRDDPILENFSPYEIGAQFFGFMPARYEQQLSINRAQQEIGKRVDAEISGMLRRLYMARREGDRDTFQEVIQDIIDFNERVPPNARITRDTIERSLQSHQRTTRDMQAGVTLSRRLRPELMQLASDYGPVSWMDTRQR